MHGQTLEERQKHLKFISDLDKKVLKRQKEIESEVVENVLIKEVTGGGDKVFIINKLPKTMLYKAEREMVPLGKDQTDQPTGEVIDKLLPGIELSQTGDDGYTFHDIAEAKKRLAAIDRYIRGLWPHTKPLPRREYLAMQPGHPASPPRPVSAILRVDLSTSPPAEQSAALSQPSLSKEAIEAIKAQVLADVRKEQAQENKAKMEKVRAAKKKD